MRSPGFLHSQQLAREGFPHAFFTREGGVSQNAYASLNFSFGVGDEKPRVEENFKRAAKLLNVAPQHILFLSQVHGAHVVRAEPDLDRSAALKLEGDALWGDSSKHACGVRTADCVPILLADPESGRVAAIHSGWRGCVANVTASTVEALSNAGTDPARLIAAIGPHICVDCFEVSSEVADQLSKCSNATNAVSHDHGPKPHVNLRSIVRAQLLASGLRTENVEDVVGCTMQDANLFFSYRRDGPRSGRHLSAIVAQD